MDAPAPPLSDDLLARFTGIVGPANALRDTVDIAPYLSEPREKFHGRTPLVLRAGSVNEVSAILRLASDTGTPIVPRGGGTGLVGGQIPDMSGRQIVLSLGRLNRIRAIDPAGDAMIAEAGATLAEAHHAADAADRLFPLSLGSEGTCQIGGNISTNAGGTAVLAYGNTRALVLGIEVVLASGEILHGLRTLHKDNTGYDLKDLFIGAEGTLGVITAAALRLFPKPRGKGVAFVGLKDPGAALNLLAIARGEAGTALTAFELMPRIGLEAVVRHLPGARDPLAGRHDWYVLLEVSSIRSQADADAAIEAIFEAGFAAEAVEDGVRAESLQQTDDFWRMRHSLSEIQKFEGGSIKHDVAVPVSAVPDFLAEASAAVVKLIPGARPFPFGHVGDGNIHFNISQPKDMDKAAFLARWEEVNALVHGIVGEYQGTISAEHGIGALKRDILRTVKSPIEIALMEKIKRAFDPAGILNPGKVL